MRGAASNYGVFCGTLCVSLPELPTRAGWHMGAALSFILHIMFIEVDLLVMDMLVVCFIFLLMEPLILLIGIVVLL